MGTVTCLVKQAKYPLYTLYEVIYDIDPNEVDECGSDDEKEKEIQTVFKYELLADYINEDLIIIKIKIKTSS